MAGRLTATMHDMHSMNYEEGVFMAAAEGYSCNYHLRPGFRFYPTEEELLSFYLHHKLHHHHDQNDGVAELRKLQIDRLIPVVDIYQYNPWDLPQLAAGQQDSGGGGEQWFFFGGMQEREARGGRPKRVAGCGYWKATGTLGYVYSQNGGRCIGEKRTMVFYTGKAPKGRKTDWKFNEYKAYEFPADIVHLHANNNNNNNNNSLAPAPPPFLAVRHELSVIRVYKKSKCLRSFDRRPIMTTTTSTNNQLISDNYNFNPPDHHHQPQQVLLPYSVQDLQPATTAYNNPEAYDYYNYYRPSATATILTVPAGGAFSDHGHAALLGGQNPSSSTSAYNDQPPPAPPRVEYLSSTTSSPGWTTPSPPPQETAAVLDNDHDHETAFWGCCFDELDWYDHHTIIGEDDDDEMHRSLI